MILRRRQLLASRSKLITETGYLVSFTATASVPLEGFLLLIEPYQAGTGDPSGSNIRALTGRTNADWFSDINFFPPGLSDSDFTLNRALDGSGKSVSSNYYKISKTFLPCGFLAGKQWTTNWVRSTGGTGNPSFAFYSDPDENAYVSKAYKAAAADSTMTFTVNSKARYMRLCMNKSTAIGSRYIVTGSSAPGATPPYATPVNVDWSADAGTVYAATFDVLTGDLTVRPYYASYAGETLVGPWISDRDVYAAGTTPTIGAQVVDLGGVDTVHTLYGIPLYTASGVNNFWTTAGRVSVTRTP